MNIHHYKCNKCGCEDMKAEHRRECHGCENQLCDHEDDGKCDLDGFEAHGQPCPAIKNDCKEFYRNECECDAGACYGGGCWILNCSNCGSQVEQVPSVEP